LEKVSCTLLPFITGYYTLFSQLVLGVEGRYALCRFETSSFVLLLTLSKISGDVNVMLIEDSSLLGYSVVQTAVEVPT
jgi:hypothetical protein